MGNWFGSPEPTQSSRVQTHFNYESSYWSPVTVRRHHTQDTQRLEHGIRNLRISSEPTTSYRPTTYITAGSRSSTTTEHRRSVRTIQNPLGRIKPVENQGDQFILNFIQTYADELNWDCTLSYSYQQVHFIELDQFSEEYLEVASMFRNTNKKCFVITQIERIQNPYLLAAFLLKRKESAERTEHQTIEKLFHGTKSENVSNICRNNFDWRLYGQNVGNKFGQGISFTPISNYATYYSDENSNSKVMLMVHVLVGSMCLGKPHMVIPPDGYDTTAKENRHVIVKYEDNEFYPAYKITYTCNSQYELRTQQQKNRQRQSRRQKAKSPLERYVDDVYADYYYDDYGY